MLQLVNWTGWTDLVAFIEKPDPEHRFRLLSVPIFFKLTNDSSVDLQEILGVMRWVEARTRSTFLQLMVEKDVLPLASDSSKPPADDWKKVSVEIHRIIGELALTTSLIDRPAATTVCQSSGIAPSTREFPTMARRTKRTSLKGTDRAGIGAASTMSTIRSEV